MKYVSGMLDNRSDDRGGSNFGERRGRFAGEDS
jgi:hypothetical protein